MTSAARRRRRRAALVCLTILLMFLIVPGWAMSVRIVVGVFAFAFAQLATDIILEYFWGEARFR